ncbi:hypothetical protein [Nonomuraea sp. NPDC049709]|uniref:hypothetical protein n=1 Tax=Nonomuraea sp. NPDC049709 TaxID=3154736 RepID=UPI003420FB46
MSIKAHFPSGNTDAHPFSGTLPAPCDEEIMAGPEVILSRVRMTSGRGASTGWARWVHTKPLWPITSRGYPARSAFVVAAGIFAGIVAYLTSSERNIPEKPQPDWVDQKFSDLAR